jgi:hypothetical protein
VKAIKGLDKAQTAELLAMLLRMQKEEQHAEVEHVETLAIEEDDEHPEMEPYCEDDEEIVEEDLTWLLDPEDEEVENTNEGE